MDRSAGEPGALATAGWLAVDAAFAACFAGPAEALLLFLISPDRPLTLRDFLATCLALAPQIVVLFVLLGPALVLMGRALSVARSTRRGFSLRYVLRFACADAVLLAVAASWQWWTLGPIVPEPGRSALALTATALVVTALVLGALALKDAISPLAACGPWLAAVAAGLALALFMAGELRRERLPDLRPISLPGFVASRPVLLVELPGLSPEDLERASRRGETPALDALASRGVTFAVDGTPATDAMALHAGLITGRLPADHGVLNDVRYRPLGDRRSFAVLPRGLLLRPLLRTPLWARRPVDHTVLRTAALPEIVASLSPWPGDAPALFVVADPLGWPTALPGREVVGAAALVPGRRVLLANGADAFCADPGNVRERFFDPPASDLAETERLARLLREALGGDLCALMLARQGLTSGARIVHVRLFGHGRVAHELAGFRRIDPARGVTEREIAAFGSAPARYVRALDPEIGALLDAAGPERRIVFIAPHGIRARTDIGRLIAGLIGKASPTGTHEGPPRGVAIVAGEGFVSGGRLDRTVPLNSILPTLLFASDLPVAGDMGPVARDVFEPSFLARRSLITVPSYRETKPTALTGAEERDTYAGAPATEAPAPR